MKDWQLCHQPFLHISLIECVYTRASFLSNKVLFQRQWLSLFAVACDSFNTRWRYKSGKEKSKEKWILNKYVCVQETIRARLAAVITFLPPESHLFTDQIESLKIIACHSAPSWEVSLNGGGHCVGSAMMCEHRNTSKAGHRGAKQHVALRVM